MHCGWQRCSFSVEKHFSLKLLTYFSMLAIFYCTHCPVLCWTGKIWNHDYNKKQWRLDLYSKLKDRILYNPCSLNCSTPNMVYNCTIYQVTKVTQNMHLEIYPNSIWFSKELKRCLLGLIGIVSLVVSKGSSNKDTGSAFMLRLLIYGKNKSQYIGGLHVFNDQQVTLDPHYKKTTLVEKLSM